MNRNQMSAWSIALVVWGAGSGLRAAQPPPTLVPCPFTPAEIEVALGVVVDAGEAADMTAPDSHDVGCIYPVRGSETVLTVRQTWTQNGPGSQAPTTRSDGGLRAIPGDPDGATSTASDQGVEPTVELVYSRGKTRTRVFVHGGHFRPEDMHPKVLKLKRVP